MKLKINKYQLHEMKDCLNDILLKKLNYGYHLNCDLESDLDIKVSNMLYNDIKDVLRYDLLDILNNNIEYEFK